MGIREISILICLSLFELGVLWSQDDSNAILRDYLDKRIEQLEIESISDVSGSSVIRIWEDVRLIELVRTSENEYKGNVIQFTEKLNRKNKARIIKETFEIDTKKSRSLFSVLETNRVFTLPDCNKIPGYPSGLDGSMILFSVRTNGIRRLYGYWEPESNYYGQDKFEEIVYVREILNVLEKELDLENRIDNFIEQLPKRRYRWGGTIMIKTRN